MGSEAKSSFDEYACRNEYKTGRAANDERDATSSSDPRHHCYTASTTNWSSIDTYRTRPRYKSATACTDRLFVIFLGRDPYDSSYPTSRANDTRIKPPSGPVPYPPIFSVGSTAWPPPPQSTPPIPSFTPLPSARPTVPTFNPSSLDSNITP